MFKMYNPVSMFRTQKTCKWAAVSR